MNHSKENKQTHAEVYATRLATPDDVQTLVEIGTETFRDTFAADNTPENMKAYLEKNFAPDQIRQDIDDPDSVFILAYDKSRIVGYAKLRKGKNPGTESSSIEIERIYAIKEYIGKKVGKTLMQTSLDFAAELGYKKVWLGVWEHNPRAIAFYERWGFKISGSHPFLLGDDLQTDLLMEKKLDDDETASL